MLEGMGPDALFEIQRGEVTDQQREVAQRLRELADRIDAGTVEARVIEEKAAVAHVADRSGRETPAYTGELTLVLTLVDFEKVAAFRQVLSGC